MFRGRAALRAGGRDSIEYRELNRAVRSVIHRDTRLSIEDSNRERRPRSDWQSMRSVVVGKRSSRRCCLRLSSEELNHFFVSVGLRVAAGVEDWGRVAAHEAPCRLPRVGACGFRVLKA